MTQQPPREHSAVAVIDAERLVVTARLQQGAALDIRWPITLDAILSFAARRRRLGRSYGVVIDHHQDPLGLCRLNIEAGAQWSWAATCARPVGTTEEELHWWHSRFDHPEAERVVSALPPIVRSNQGRYRLYRTPVVVTVAGSLQWRAIGDPVRIKDLLDDVLCIGKKHSQGEGMVLGWDVTSRGPVGDGRLHVKGGPISAAARWLLRDPDGRISRPITVRSAPVVSPGAEQVEAPLRPPYFQGKRLRPAIAPWAQVA